MAVHGSRGEMFTSPIQKKWRLWRLLASVVLVCSLTFTPQAPQPADAHHRADASQTAFSSLDAGRNDVIAAVPLQVTKVPLIMAPEQPCPGLEETPSTHLYLPLLLHSLRSRGPKPVLTTLPQAAPELVLPASPATTAPPLNRTVATDIFSATLFLYTGTDPLQTNVVSGSIRPESVSIVRGLICHQNGTPLPGATIRIPTHPEYGQTLSRADGRFDFVVNGGQSIILEVSKPGHLPSQRTLDLALRAYAALDAIVLLGLDTVVNVIDLQAPDPMQIARGSQVSDADGTRQATLLIPQHTTAELVLSNGLTETLDTLHIRATEYTVGVNGLAAMPGTLPPQSGYTYAVEYSVDEALAADATEVRFSQPLYNYVENFLDFPVGMAVPTGYYDRQAGLWKAADNGRVVKILSVANGQAELDTDGDGAADNDSALGITLVEQQQLASLYGAGQSLWRVPLTHFTPWDHNWPYGPSPEAQDPGRAGNPPPRPNLPPEDNPCTQPGSIIACQNQSLGEMIPVQGTAYALHYQSERVPGRSSKSLDIPLIGATIPPGLQSIELEILVAGQYITQQFSATVNQQTTFTWDGYDIYGRLLQGQVEATVRVGYRYGAVYQEPANFAQSFGQFSGIPITGNRSRNDVTLWQESTTFIGGLDAQGQQNGGWTLSPHHTYHPTSQILHYGDGTQRNTAAGQTANVAQPIIQPQLIYQVKDVALGPDGSMYIAGDHRLWKIQNDHPILIAGLLSGNWGGTGNGDNGPASEAELRALSSVIVGSNSDIYLASGASIRKITPDGIIRTLDVPGLGSGSNKLALDAANNLYIADPANHRVLKVDQGGVLTVVAGNGQPCVWADPCGDGMLATQAAILAYDIAIGPDQMISIAGGDRIRQIDASGVIHTIAGGGTNDQDDGIPATAAKIASIILTVAADGSLYLDDNTPSGYRVRRIANGLISTIAGNGRCSSPTDACGDGGPAVDAYLDAIVALVPRPDGGFYIGTTNRMRSVDPLGVITSVVESGLCVTAAGLPCYGEGVPAADAEANPRGVVVATDGTIYFSDQAAYTIRRIDPAGIISTVAGNGQYCAYNTIVCGEGGPATQAPIGSVNGLALGPDGSLYLIDNLRRVRKVDAAGIITTVAGNGQYCADPPCGDGLPATQAPIGSVDLAVDHDQSLYILDEGSRHNALRKITPNGIIQSIALSITQNMYPHYAITLGPDSAIYLAVSILIGPGTWMYQIHRIGPDGQTDIIAGGGLGGCRSLSCDGGLATEAYLSYISDLVVGPDNTLYIAENDYRVRMITPNGIITSIAGGARGFGARSGSAMDLRLVGIAGIALDPQGNLLISSPLAQSLIKVSSLFPRFSLRDRFITSEDGSLLYRFNANGRHLETLHTLTGAVLLRFEYDSGGRLIRISDADANTTTIERSPTGDIQAIVAPYGQRTTITLDANHYISRITNPATESFQFGYTADGLLTTMTDPRGQQTSYRYDGQGRLMGVTDRAGGTQSLSRTGNTASYSVLFRDGEQRPTTYTVERSPTGDRTNTTLFSDATRIQSLARPNGTSALTLPNGLMTTSKLGPDPRWGMQVSQPVSQTLRTPVGLTRQVNSNRTAVLGERDNPLSLESVQTAVSVNGKTSLNRYDAASRTYTLTSPTGRYGRVTIDINGNPLTMQQPGLATMAYTYDSRGRVASLVEGSGAETRTTSLAYNSAGLLSSITNSLGQTDSMIYDAAGRLTKYVHADATSIGYTYDANGNLSSLIPPGRTAHSFDYTPIDLMASSAPPSVGTDNGGTLYSYNFSRQLTRVTRPDGVTVGLAYDAAGHLDTLSIPRGTFSYSYNAATGTLANLNAPENVGLAYSYNGPLLTDETWSGPVAGRVGYDYDNDFRLVSSSVNGGHPIALQYDPDSLLTKVGDLSLSRNAQNGLLTGSVLGGIADTWSYNGFAEPTGYSATSSGAPRYSVSYTRDKLGRIVTKSETISGTTTIYDYGYDLIGQLTSVTQNGVLVASYTYDTNGNRLSGPGIANATYDAQDRLLSYGVNTYAYTANGELLSKTAGGQTTTYQYDELGSLLAVGLPNGTQISYLVDGQGRRIGRTVNGTLTQGLLYEGQLRPIAELDGTGAVVSRFVYATHVNVPDYMIKGGATYRIITDQLGSPRLVLNVADGSVIQRMDYDTWGKVTQDTNPGFQPFGFAGGLYDRDTKLVRFGTRDYDAEAGRWTAKDLLGFRGGDTNLYRYVLSDPLNQTDPPGLTPLWKIFTRPFYGNYLGPGNYGYDKAPITAIDAAACRHDQAYDKAGADGVVGVFTNVAVRFADLQLAYDSLQSLGANGLQGNAWAIGATILFGAVGTTKIIVSGYDDLWYVLSSK